MLDPTKKRDSDEAAAGDFDRLANVNIMAASAAIDELVRCGLRDVCISPGSRSAPLTLAFNGDQRVRTHVHVDERCAGFYALGVARATRRPVALVCTSGSAAGHYLPAVIEAYETGVPLVVITADRPLELLDSGSPQTTDQYGLFGNHVQCFQAIECPRPEARWMRWLRGRICRVLEAAQTARPGPVHLNFHFDEPLSTVQVDSDRLHALAEADSIAAFGRPDGRPFSPWASAELRPSGSALEELAELVRSKERGVLVVGPLDANSEESQAIAFLARALGVPVLADPLSGLRRPAASGVALITAYDAFLREDGVAVELEPEWILRLGRVPTSKALVQWMARHHAARLVVVDEQGRREDPNHSGALFVRARTAATCGVLGTAIRAGFTPSEHRNEWTNKWVRVDEAAAGTLSLGCADAPDSFEGRLVELLGTELPEGSTLLAASSMPIRELDTFLRGGESALRVVSNRGVNGIDGLVSTAFGIGSAVEGPMVALLGDLAFLHDVGGLAAVARSGATGTLLIVNNGGGGIFDYLPVAETSAPTGEFFVAEHGHAFHGAAELYGLEYHAPTNVEDLALLLRRSSRNKARIIELVVDRKSSVAYHKALWTAVGQASLHTLSDLRDEL